MSALAPLTCGNVRESISSPAWDSVPGIEKVLSVPLANSATPPPASARMSSQADRTRHGWRNDQRPRVYRKVDTVAAPEVGGGSIQHRIGYKTVS